MTTAELVTKQETFTITAAEDKMRGSRTIRSVAGATRPGMKWPDRFDCTNPGLFGHLTVGKQVTVTLKRGNLKNGKTGQYDDDYYWDIVGVNGQGETAAPAPANGHAPAAAPAAPAQATRPANGHGGMDMETTRRITFLSALNAAATYYAAPGSGDADKVLEIAAKWANAAFAYGRNEANSPLVDAAKAEGATVVEDVPWDPETAEPTDPLAHVPATIAGAKSKMATLGWTETRIANVVSRIEDQRKKGMSEMKATEAVWQLLRNAGMLSEAAK